VGALPENSKHSIESEHLFHSGLQLLDVILHVIQLLQGPLDGKEVLGRKQAEKLFQ